jgi:hypothetical protein
VLANAYQLVFPTLIAVAGKKKAGKDTVCDSLADFGFTKLHIAEPWLRDLIQNWGITWGEYQKNKGYYRAEVQRCATIAREDNPRVLIDRLLPTVNRFRAEQKALAVTGIRFHNEALWFIEKQALVVRVDTPEEERLIRFLDEGEDPSLLRDPFESELDDLPCHLVVRGTEPPHRYPTIISAGYVGLLRGTVHTNA